MRSPIQRLLPYRTELAFHTDANKWAEAKKLTCEQSLETNAYTILICRTSVISLSLSGTNPRALLVFPFFFFETLFHCSHMLFLFEFTHLCMSTSRIKQGTRPTNEYSLVLFIRIYTPLYVHIKDPEGTRPTNEYSLAEGTSIWKTTIGSLEWKCLLAILCTGWQARDLVYFVVVRLG